MSASQSIESIALAIIDGYNAWDLDKLMEHRAPECVHQILPKSLGREPLGNDAYRAYFTRIMPLFRDFRVSVHNTIVGDKEVALQATSTADTDAGPYANEYVLIFTFNEAGDKVIRVQEFVDSHNSVTFFPKLWALIK
ncbi:putative SLAM family member 5 [Echria macrotheca]|uniref:SLAM family member 5 n=1 Tax=Echria macrotheca TaxID=438768 RepID=A0AAJ0BHE0_9PEZI|nr:putative SLAM family member 5 [Echria macrotheca]